MTSTILPPERTAVIRSVAKSAAVLFTLMQIEVVHPGRAVTVMELAGILAMDTRTVERHLMKLSTSCLVSLQGDRWMLTPSGRGTLFPENAQASHLSIEESETLLLEAEIPAQNVHLDRLDREIQTINVKPLSSISQDCTKCADIPQILQAAAELLNCEITVHDIMLKRDVDFVLGWIAKAYADMTRPGSTLRSPGGLVYRRLLELATLPVMYQKNPTRGLPAAFLREIGMADEAEKLESRAEKVEAEKVDMSDYLRQLNESRNQLVEYAYPTLEARDSFGRNMRWLEIIKDARYEKPTDEKNKERRGIGFAGDEPVQFDGSTLLVTVSHHGSREDDYAALANQWYSGLFSEIYQDQSGDPSARVIFVNEVEA